MTKFKVAANTAPGKLAAAIAGVIKTDEIELTSIGAASVNNAVKAAIHAEELLNRTSKQGGTILSHSTIELRTIGNEETRAIVTRMWWKELTSGI